jgi:hypothetical protein
MISASQPPVSVIVQDTVQQFLWPYVQFVSSAASDMAPRGCPGLPNRVCHQSVRRRWHDEEIGGDQLLRVLAKNVLHVCEGRGQRRAMYFATVVCAIVKPSFSNSP